MLAEIQRLRYDVYCIERGFLDRNNFPDARESDAYDDYAIQLVARNADGQVSGTARLVLDSELGFPLEAHASGLGHAFHSIERDRTAEISRLAVAKSGRQIPKAGHLRANPLVLFKLFREMCVESRRLGLDYWLASMEPTLQRLLRRLVGFEFIQIGDPMDYYGEVVPYMASIPDFIRTLERDRPDLYEYFGYGTLTGGTPIASPH
jgi:N-acyl amino acid synthase of PEP-CTERM/exosortase system